MSEDGNNLQDDIPQEENKNAMHIVYLGTKDKFDKKHQDFQINDPYTISFVEILNDSNIKNAINNGGDRVLLVFELDANEEETIAILLNNINFSDVAKNIVILFETSDIKHTIKSNIEGVRKPVNVFIKYGNNFRNNFKQNTQVLKAGETELLIPGNKTDQRDILYQFQLQENDIPWWVKKYVYKPHCAEGRLSQFSGTCWLNSIINIFLLTPVFRKVLNEKLNNKSEEEKIRIASFDIINTCPSDIETGIFVLIQKLSSGELQQNATSDYVKKIGTNVYNNDGTKGETTTSMNEKITRILKTNFDNCICEIYSKDKKPLITRNINNVSYTLVAAECDISYNDGKGHSIAALICDDIYYLYDANNYLVKCDWQKGEFDEYIKETKHDIESIFISIAIHVPTEWYNEKMNKNEEYASQNLINEFTKIPVSVLVGLLATCPSVSIFNYLFCNYLTKKHADIFDKGRSKVIILFVFALIIPIVISIIHCIFRNIKQLKWSKEIFIDYFFSSCAPILGGWLLTCIWIGNFMFNESESETDQPQGNMTDIADLVQPFCVMQFIMTGICFVVPFLVAKELGKKDDENSKQSSSTLENSSIASSSSYSQGHFKWDSY
jgi:hypothetical protein